MKNFGFALLIGICCGWYAHSYFYPTDQPFKASLNACDNKQDLVSSADSQVPPQVPPLVTCPVVATPSAATPVVNQTIPMTEPTYSKTDIATLYRNESWQEIADNYALEELSSTAELLAFGHANIRINRLEIGIIALNNAEQTSTSTRTKQDVIAIIENELNDREHPALLDNRIALLRALTTIQSQEYAYWEKLAHALIEADDFLAAKDAVITLSASLEFSDKASMLMDRIEKMELMSGMQSQRIALKKYGDQYLIEMTLNGSYSDVFLIDTGASVTTISPNTAKQLRIDTINSPELNFETANGRRSAKQVVLSSASIDKVTVANLPAGIIELNSKHFDGLLGMNFLNQFNFYIDQQTNELHLAPK